MLLCGEPPEMTKEDKTDSRLALILDRAEMLWAAALPGWRRRRTEAVVGSTSLPTSLMCIVAFLSDPSVEEVWSESLAVGPLRVIIIIIIIIIII